MYPVPLTEPETRIFPPFMCSMLCCQKYFGWDFGKRAGGDLQSVHQPNIMSAVLKEVSKFESVSPDNRC